MQRSVELPNYSKLKRRLGIVQELNASFPLRAEKNRTDGILVYSSKSLVLFNGFEPEMERRTMPVIAELDTDSAQDVYKRVSGPLADLARRHGISLSLLPETHFPYHITLQKFRYNTDSVNTQAQIEQTIAQLAPQLMESSADIPGITIPLNRLVLAGSNLYICMEDPTRDEDTFAAFWRVLKGREAINGVYEQSLINPSLAHSSKILNDQDIIHASIGRIIGLSSQTDLITFSNEAYATIGRALQLHPILATIESIYSGSTFDYMQQH